MSKDLLAYKQKRTKPTSEPQAKKFRGKKSKHLIFSVQEHHARRLHYDLRLELEGVLKSWAIPKGPSLNPQIKRLAIEVEDHPYDYAYFEGTIPRGSYGAGKVILWDHGTYRTLNANSREEQEKELLAQYKKGHLKIVFEGEKLRGAFDLVRIRNDEKQNQWLLIKKEDGDASWEEKESILELEDEEALHNALAMPIKGVPQQIKPMLCYTVDSSFDKKGWIFEVKWDGYRAISHIEKGHVSLYSRNFLAFEKKFPTVVKALSKISANVVLDGEIVIMDKEGKSQFQELQNYLDSKKNAGALRYCLFDLLFFEGHDIRHLPLHERKSLLKILLEGVDDATLVYSDHIENQGIHFYQEAVKMNLEGIIAKNGDSSYVSQRSKNWLKIKTTQRQEVVIVGYTSPKGTRKGFGSLILGIYENKSLIYVGNVGTGFNTESIDEIYRLLQTEEQEKSPLEISPKLTGKISWVRPIFSCEVSFTEWTKAGHMRHPVFQGLRIEKPAESIHKEKTNKTKALLSDVEKLESNTDKIFWPKEKYTKGDLINYYKSVAPYILPHLKNRPIMLHRFPNGIQGQDFVQKNMAQRMPEWFKTAAIEHGDKTISYSIINDIKSLIYIVNLGTIDIHPFLSRVEHLNEPDFIVLDLDPVGLAFDSVIEVAQMAHEVLEKINVASFCKTSGKRGLHIYIPLNAKYPFDIAENFAKLIAQIIYEEMPEKCSLERLPKNRNKKIYLDCLQNSPTKTVVAPYAVRALDNAPVAAPLEWHEVNKGLDPASFTMVTMPERLKKKGDLFKGVLGKGANIEKAIKKIDCFWSF